MTPASPYIMSPTYETRKIFVFVDIVHAWKNFCFALMDRLALLPKDSQGKRYFVGKDDFLELLPHISSEISIGYRFTFHIQIAALVALTCSPAL